MESHFRSPKTSVLRASEAISVLRLDASFFVGATADIMSILASNNSRTIQLKELAKVLMLSGFSINWIPAKGSSHGIAMYPASAITELDPNPSIFISARVDPNVDYFKVCRGWIAITRSGTVGNVGLIYRNLDGTYLSNDAIRIIPYDSECLGFIYVFLSSIYGRTLLEDMTYGSVVGHIKTFQVESLPLPQISREIKRQLGKMVQRIMELREESYALLKKVESIVLEINGLLPLYAENGRSVGYEKAVNTVQIFSKMIWESYDGNSEYRLDANFYNPMAQLAIENIKQSKAEVKTIEDVTERVFLVPRFKRNYVDKEYGIPFLSGKNIVQIRPTDLKYISLSETVGIDELKLKESWTLVTRSGTLGRTCFVWKNYEDFTATEHIMRLEPDKNRIDPGYLYAFLSSKYGNAQILRYHHGSVIDEITDKQVKKIVIPIPTKEEQKGIGDLVRSAYEKRAEAISLEDKAQEILMEVLTK